MSTQIKIADASAVEVLNTWYAAQKKFTEAYTRLQSQFNQECQTLLDEINRVSRSSFSKISEHYKVPGDPLDHFKSGAWFVDFSYFEQHGDAYLCQAKSPVIDTEAKLPEEKKHTLQ
jgi:hypothetical protein